MLNAPPPLHSLPASAKLLLTLFLVLIGTGYLSALGNLYHQHSLADGRPGMSLGDLRAAFHGVEVEQVAGGSNPAAVPLSRMMEMIQPGGDMRKHLVKGGEQAVRALETWLAQGAPEFDFTTKALAQAGDPSAADVLMSRCLDCHNADGGEKADTPFGPDLFTVEYRLAFKVAAPGTALADAGHDSAGPTGAKTRGPQTLPHLFLVTHIHMLSIPVFTLIVAVLFLCSSVNPAARRLLAPIPMAALTCDFASWWLARLHIDFVYVIAAAGAVYGLSLAFQILSVLASMWLRRTARERLA